MYTRLIQPGQEKFAKLYSLKIRMDSGGQIYMLKALSTIQRMLKQKALVLACPHVEKWHWVTQSYIERELQDRIKGVGESIDITVLPGHSLITSKCINLII